MGKPVCFVIQGFGEKTDFTDGRKLNLDASYSVIKEAVEAAGVACHRADEIVHSGTIDIPMYEQLLRADLVIADLSTYNVNAAFELGVRYALRPRATIVVAESGFKSPFDVNHIVIRRYEHLGKDLGLQEARRFKKELVTLIKSILASERPDSPVYTTLHGLQPPVEPAVATALAAVGETRHAARPAAGPAVGAETPPQAASADSRSAREWQQAGHDAMAREDWPLAIRCWQVVQRMNPSDTQAVQQLARSTYMSGQPGEREALALARETLLPLQPEITNDPETLGLWGAIHERLWALDHDAVQLAAAIDAYQRAFSLRQDPDNGLRLASVLMQRALQSAIGRRHDEAVADRVQAERSWRAVIRIATPLVRARSLADADRFRLLAGLSEAALGLGDTKRHKRWQAQADKVDVASSLRGAQRARGERLHGLKHNLAAALDAAAAAAAKAGSL